MTPSKIERIRNYINENIHRDSDFWSLGGGSQEIQKRFNSFSTHDWESLKREIPKWNSEEIDLIVDSVAFGFDGAFTPFLNPEMISEAGKFLLDLFISNIGDRNEIVYFSFFIAKSPLTNRKDLKVMRDWLYKNGYDNEAWRKSKINPLGNMEIAIKNNKQ